MKIMTAAVFVGLFALSACQSPGGSSYNGYESPLTSNEVKR